MGKVYDCFTFYNELRLLELRLQLHWDSVDRFVIAEATRTFQGAPKALYLRDAKARFAPYWHKIDHVVVDDLPQTDNSWDREAHQRNALARGLDGAVADDDIILLSDVDELIRPDALQALRQRPPGPRDIICFELDLYLYYLNLKHRVPWLRQSPRAILRKNLKQFQTLRTVRGPTAPMARDLLRALRTARAFGRLMKRRVVRKAGWHFSWLGGEASVTEKIGAISTHGFMAKTPNGLRDQARAQMQAAQKQQGDISIVEIDASYPQIMRDNIEHWQDLIFSPPPVKA